MADIFDEINADLRQERLRRIWDRYGIYVILVALIIVLSVAGSALYGGYVKSRNEAASLRYENLLMAIAAQSLAEQQAALLGFAESEANAYGLLARFRQARLLQAAGRTDEAVALYDGLAENADLPPAIRDYMRLSAAYLLLDKINAEAMRLRLAPLMQENHHLRHAAAEIIVFSLYQAGDYLAARDILDMAQKDTAMQPHFQVRLNILRDLVTQKLLNVKS